MSILDPVVAPGRSENPVLPAGQRLFSDLLPAALTLLLAAGILLGLIWGYRATATRVSVRVDGYEATLRSHQATVGDLLAEIELTLQPEDRLLPPPETRLRAGLVIQIERARPLLLDADSHLRSLHSQAATVGQALDEAGVALGPADELALAGENATLDSPLPPRRTLAAATAAPSGLQRIFPWRGTRLEPVRISLRRAVPLTIDDDGPPVTVWTTASTVGEALAREGLFFYAGDLVRPGLGQPVSAGLNVEIVRSRPLSIISQRGQLFTRSRSATVADLLAEESIVLVGEDRVEPALDAPLTDNLAVQVTRISHDFEIVEQITPYRTVWESDPELEIDNNRLDQEGVNGIVRDRYRIELVDGRPITRMLEDRWLAQEPITRVLNYGTKIALREVETPEGPKTYWRKVRMFATSYTAADSGTPRSAPYYGLTRLGWQMRFGIVAVDPSVISLRSRVYVPGYGVGDVGDTGSAIRGRWIDLGYDDGGLIPWSRCVDVYLLAPVPPSYQITYRLPGYPNVPCLR